MATIEECNDSKSSPKLVRCKSEGTTAHLPPRDQNVLHGNSRLCARAPPSVHIPLRGQATLPKESRVCLSTVHRATPGTAHRHTALRAKGDSSRRAIKRASRSLWLIHTHRQEAELTSCRMGKHAFVMLTPACTPGSGNPTFSVPCSPDK